MEERELKTILESILFVSTEPLSLEKLRDVLEGMERAKIARVLEAIREEFIAHDHGFQLVETGGGYQIATVPGSAPWVKKLDKVRSASKLSKPSLEVLAIVAYRQGITRPEIEAIRGVDCGGVVRSLMERRLVKILGRKETVGRPLMYGTTKDFLLAFGLRDLTQLPSLKEFKELTEEDPEFNPLLGDQTEVEGSSAFAAPAMGSTQAAEESC